jgi:hypothetical protein
VLISYLEVSREHLREDLRHRQLMYQVRVCFAGSKGVDVPEIPKLLLRQDK